METDQAVRIALAAWFALTALAVLYVSFDAFRRTPEMMVMKWGWVLVTSYTGPVGGALYVLSCQEPHVGTHEDFVRPLWKQALGSTVHCLAGDATGIIAAAAITMALGLRMWQDLVAEYFFGFAFGLLVFQAVFMRDMLGGSYRAAVRRDVGARGYTSRVRWRNSGPCADGQDTALRPPCASPSGGVLRLHFR